MATTITKQVLENGPRNYIALFTIASDGSAESMDGAIDPTSGGDMGVNYAGNTLYPNTHLKIWELRYDLPVGMNVRLTWEATSDQEAWDLYGFGHQKFMRQGGVPVPQSGDAPIAGATGKIDLTAVAYTLAEGTTTAYGTVQVWVKKDVNANDPPYFNLKASPAGVAATGAAQGLTPEGEVTLSGEAATSAAEAVTTTG